MLLQIFPAQQIEYLKQILIVMLKQTLVKLLVHLRLDYAAQHYLGGAGSILMFHRVTKHHVNGSRLHLDSLEITADYFERIIKYIKKKYDVLAIGDIADFIRKKRKKRFVCITFDDGYRDNYDVAYPILKQYQVPAAIYICTSFPDKSAVLWPYALEALLLQNDRISIEHQGGVKSFKAQTLEQKRNVYDQVWNIMSVMSYAEINDIFNQYGLNIKKMVTTMAMDWEQIKVLSDDPLITIGAHTVTHPIMSGLSHNEVEREIVESRSIIESHIGKHVEHFSYPFGAEGMVGEREFHLVEQFGFKTGVTTRRGNVFNEHMNHLYSLPRIEVGKTQKDMSFFISQISGLRLALKGQFKRPVL